MYSKQSSLMHIFSKQHWADEQQLVLGGHVLLMLRSVLDQRE